MTWVVVNVTGEHTFELTADRSRFAGDNLDIWRRIYSVYSEVIESLYQGSASIRSPANWWEYHLRYYSSSSGEVPSALEVSALDESIFCVLTTQGFEQLSLLEIRRRSKRLFWSRQFDHEYLSLFKSLLTEEDGIVIMPDPFNWRFDGWIWSLTNISPDRDLGSFLRTSGAKVFVRRVLGAETVLIDTGHQLGPWGIPVGWPNEVYDMRAAFDALHPLSQQLLSLADSKAPTALTLLAYEVLELAPIGDVAEFQGLQQEFLADLQRDGYISQQSIGLHFAESPSPNHECPYPVDRWEGISI